MRRFVPSDPVWYILNRFLTSIWIMLDMRSVCLLQVEVKGRVNLDKLTAFLEELRVSKSRTVSLGALMSARDASAADKTHLVEVRHGYAASRQDTIRICSFSTLCGGFCWVINGHPQTLALHACTTVASLLYVCFICAVLCLYFLMCSANAQPTLHFWYGMLQQQQSNSRRRHFDNPHLGEIAAQHCSCDC